MKELRIQILNPQNLAYTTLWINSCIILNDSLRNGVEWEREQRQEGITEDPSLQRHDRQQLHEEGKQGREQIKAALLYHLD